MLSMWKSQETCGSQVFPSTLWGIELRLSGLVTSAEAHTEPSYQPYANLIITVGTEYQEG